MTTTEENSAHPLLIGEILVQADIVGEHQLPRALQMAKDRSLRIGQVLVMMRYLADDELEPILEIQKLINDRVIDSESAIEALRVMRRDGVPLARAVEKVRIDPPVRLLREQQIQQLSVELESKERSGSDSSRELVPLIVQLGDARLDLREPAEAEKYYKRALSILEHSHGVKNVKVVPVLLKLLDLFVLMQRYTDAESLCWRCVEINQGTYGPEHVETARSFQKLSRVLDAQGRHAEAEQFLLSTIRIMEKHLGVDHPELKGVLRHYSYFWKRNAKQSEHKRIGELLVEAELIGADDLTVALQQSHKSEVPLGQILVQSGIISQWVLRAGLQSQLLVQDGVIPCTVATRALKLVAQKEDLSLEDALEDIGWQADPISTKQLQKLMETSDELMAAEHALGASHPGVSIIAMKLGEQYTYARKFAYAETSYKRALSILKQCWGQNSVELADCLFKLANLYYVQKRYTEAEGLHWKVLEIRKNAYSEEHPEVAESLEHIARLAEAQGNDDQAVHMRQAAALIRSAGTDERKLALEFFRGLNLFKVLDESTLDRISGLGQRLIVPPGGIILDEAEHPDALYVVQSGRVDLLRADHVVTCVQPGESFGHCGGLNEDADKIGARALEATAILKLSSDIVRELRSKFIEFDEAVGAIRSMLKSFRVQIPPPLPGSVAARAALTDAKASDESINAVAAVFNSAAARMASTPSNPLRQPADATKYGAELLPSPFSDQLFKVVEPNLVPSPVSASLQGNLAFFDLATVLQTIANSRNEGYLRLSDHKKVEVAKFALRNGHLIVATYRHLQGFDAIYDLISRNDPLDFVFEQTPIVGKEDASLATQSLAMTIMEAARRSDELPSLLESVGWPRVSFIRNARVLDCASLPEEVASVAADIWLLLEDGMSNEQIIEGVYSDRYTFLIALRHMVHQGAIKRDDTKSTGSFRRLADVQNRSTENPSAP